MRLWPGSACPGKVMVVIRKPDKHSKGASTAMPVPLLLLLALLAFAPLAYSAGYMAGFAESEITPQVGDTLGLVGGGTGKVQSIGDPLYIQAAVLSDGSHRVALVSADLLALGEPDFRVLKQQLQERGFDHVMIAATHTHGGYLVDESMARVRDSILTSVAQAEEQMQPVTIGATRVQVDEAYNRRIIREDGVEMLWTNPGRIPNRPVDDTLGIVHLRDGDGHPFLTIFNYSAHPVVTMDLQRALVSADYPGYLRSAFKREFGGHSMFFLGAAGDVNPYHADTKPFSAAGAQARRLGEVLSGNAVRALRNLQQFKGRGHFRFDTIRMRDPEAELGLLMLTPDISLVSFPGEYFDALGRQLKSGSPVETTLFVGMSNGDLRYVPTAADAALGGYGAEEPSSVVDASTGETHVRKALERLEELSKGSPDGD